MKDAAKDTAPHGDWHSILCAECFGYDISRPCQPGPDPRDDEAADETNQPAEEESVRLAMDGIITTQQVVS